MTAASAVMSAGDHALARAVAAQEVAPVAVTQVRAGDAVRAAAVPPTPWVWLLDGSALPAPDALAALLDAAARVAAVRPVHLLAGRIAEDDGRLSPEHVPLMPQARTAVTVTTAHLGVLHVRAVTLGSVLVRREVLVDGPPLRRWPRGPSRAWTASVLAERDGFLDPHSTATAHGGHAAALRRIALSAELLSGGSLTRRERLRLAAGMAEQAGGRLTRAAQAADRRAGRGRRGRTPAGRSGRA